LGSGDTLNRGDDPFEMGDNLSIVDLGNGNEVQQCLDLSPTLSPSLSHAPSTLSQTLCLSRFSFDFHNCILTSSNQRIKCFGRNNFGQLGYGNTQDVGDNPNELGSYLPFVNLDQPVQAIFGGYEFSCAHFVNFEISCWGNNGNGRLGNGDLSDRGGLPNEMGSYLPIVQIGSSILASQFLAGHYHDMIVDDMGRIKAWGYNLYGQLGYGDDDTRGDSANEMSDYLPFIELGTGRTATMVTPAYFSSCALLDNGDMKCWGYNGLGQLGQGHGIGLGDTPNELGDNLPPINFPTGVEIDTMVFGWQHLGIISKNNEFFGWGDALYGQLGTESSLTVGNLPNEMGEYLQQTSFGSGRNVLDLSGGSDHSCAILDNYDLKCFGRNDLGQCGYQDTVQRGDNPFEMGNYLPVVNLGIGLNAISLHIGSSHSCVELNDHSLKCFGSNLYGNLGYEHVQTIGDEINEMGSYLPKVDLGDGVEVERCSDYSPTLAPSETFQPSTFQPTLIPSISFQPSFIPSSIHPTLSFSPSLSPTTGLQLLSAMQTGNESNDYINDMTLDYEDNIIVAGNYFSDKLFGIDNKGQFDIFCAKFSGNDTSFIWAYSNGIDL